MIAPLQTGKLRLREQSSLPIAEQVCSQSYPISPTGLGVQGCWAPSTAGLALALWGARPEFTPFPATPRPLERTFSTPSCGMLGNLSSGCSLGGQRTLATEAWPRPSRGPSRSFPMQLSHLLCNVTALGFPVVGGEYF